MAIKKNKIKKSPKISLYNKVAIGTAQFGQPYGISNLHGTTNYAEMKNILLTAYKNNINTIDIADSYGKSKNKLKQYFIEYPDQKWEICYKINDLKNSLKLKLSEINKNIGVIPHILMFHKFSQLFKKENLNLIKEIKQNKNLKLGCSIYYENELFKIIENDIPVDIIQAPLNILDKRFADKKILDLLEQNNITLHARSIFLQGLFFMSKKEINKKFPKLNIYDLLYNQININNYSMSELSLLWSLKCKNISKIILGFETNNQLKEILNIIKTKKLSQKVYDELLKVRLDDYNVIIPSNWENN